MKNKHDEGFSLVEILVAIVILAAFVVPICSALVMSNEMNNRTDALMQAQLAVSSAVETLMAEGISSETLGKAVEGDYGSSTTTVEEKDADGSVTNTVPVKTDRFPEVIIKVVPVEGKPWYSVTITSNDGLVTVETSIRAVTQSGGSQ